VPLQRGQPRFDGLELQPAIERIENPQAGGHDLRPNAVTLEPQATRRPRLGKSSGASGTRGVVRSSRAVERSRLPPQAGAGKRDSFYMD
jgi:hypothetical protein